MIRSTVRAAIPAAGLAVIGTAFALLASIAGAQQNPPEITSVVVNQLEVASPQIRKIAVMRSLDRNNDQYLTEDEVEPPLTHAQQSVRNVARHNSLDNHLQGSWIHQPGMSRRTDSAVRQRRLSQLSAVHRELVATGGYEISLVDESFHRLFAGMPSEQRAALLEADANGNNDGRVTVREFYFHTRRALRKKTQFEADFGEEAYVDVLRRFGVL